MDFRALNRKKNDALRRLKAKAGKFLFDYKNRNRFTPSKLKEIKKVLFLRNDNKLGDMIVSTISFREIKSRMPHAQISVIAGPSAAKIIGNNRNISHIHIYKKGFINILKLGFKLRREHFDLYIDMDKQNTFETTLLLRLIKPSFAFGFNRTDLKMYNINANIDWAKTHITQCHKSMLKTMRLLRDNDFNDKYDIFIPPPAKKAAEKFLKTIPQNKKIIIFNPFAASKHRCFSFEQAVIASKIFPKANILIIGPAGSVNSFGDGKDMPATIFKVPASLSQEYGVWIAIALLKYANLLVTPDTYIVHAAVALNKPICALYGPADGGNWYPLTENNKIMVSRKDFSLFNMATLLSDIQI